ncbi:MAG: hypothetical protein AW09_003106 [Candidatus Accumulibacter phosphatis]|uniref:Uncharacterized protein n=1 Tax=Candidatus Accumulibacter phosphatis TaxID=327160 RepID=A0A080LTG2_9PROT|nr:MAG: hypothetical protein AW09_003106 [Candidatus Accumulibacter phosphatis]
MVVEHDAVIDVEQGDDHRRRVDHRLDQGFLVPDLVFQAMDFGDVAMHSEVIENLPMRIDDGGDAQLGEILAAILVPIDQAAGPHLALRDLLPQ